MSGYAQEFQPDSDIDSIKWKQKEYREFDFTPNDKLMANKLLFNGLESESEKAKAIERLSKIASNTGDIAARAILAQFGGIDVHEAELFKAAVNPEITKIAEKTEQEILRRARIARQNGDYLRYTALSATIGYNPPEIADNIPVLDSPTADPYYDNRLEFMNDEAYHSHVGAVGNGG